MVQEIHVNPSGAVIKDVAEFASPSGKDSQRIGTEQREISDEASDWRTGGTAWGDRHKKFG
jgi:hypothetical protein